MTDSIPGAPANGGPSKDEVPPVEGKRSRRKTLTPREQYKLMYEANVSNADLASLRIGSPSEVPLRVVSYLKRRMNGASKRITTLKLRVSECGHAIRNGRSAGLPQSEVESLRMLRLQARAEIIKAQAEYEMFKQFYEEALESHSATFQSQITAAREEAYADRMASVRSKLAIELLTSASTNGEAEQVTQLKEAAAGPRAEFRAKFIELIEKLDPALHGQFTDRPKLLTQVIGRVADHYVTERKKES